MTIEQMLRWKEPRITLNKSHSFWAMKNPIMPLQGKFVQECLWTPKMYYISVDKISFNNPTPTEAVGSPISYHLNHTKSLTSWFHISKLTLSCGMDFTWYPFDLQVIASEFQCISLYVSDNKSLKCYLNQVGQTYIIDQFLGLPCH